MNVRLLGSQEKFKIAFRDEFTCQFCGDRPGNSGIEIDHLIPVSKSGSDNEENLIATCKKCNRGKSNEIVVPSLMCEGVDRLDSNWVVYKSFGEWQIKFCLNDCDCQPVFEYTPYGYWIKASRVHESDWESHVLAKEWGHPHTDSDFISGLYHFRRMVRKDCQL